MHIDWWLKHGLSRECTMFELLWILRGHITAQAHFNSRKVETFGALNVDTEPCTPLLYHDRTFSLSNFERRKMKSIQWVFNKTNCIEMRALLNIAKLHMYDTHTNNQINRGKLECMTPCLRIYQENSHLIALSYNSRLPLLQISSLSNTARILFLPRITAVLCIWAFTLFPPHWMKSRAIERVQQTIENSQKACWVRLLSPERPSVSRWSQPWSPILKR